MLIAYIKSFSHFKTIENLCDGFIMKSKFSISSIDTMSNEEMIELINYASKLNKKAIIDVSSLMVNKEMDLLDEYIYFFKGYNVSFLYTDIGVYEILKKYQIKERGIYDPKTLITNHYDMNLYLLDGIEAIGLSNEIPASKIEEIDSKKNGATWLKIFGYHQMFYSKRHLVSTYYKYKNLDKKPDRLNTYIKEETRGDIYHIDEGDLGTVIYRNYPISYMKTIENVSNIDYLVFDSSFISDDDFKKALEIYNLVLNKKMNKDMAVLKLNEIFDIKDGFIFDDTVYVKEEAKR